MQQRELTRDDGRLAGLLAMLTEMFHVKHFGAIGGYPPFETSRRRDLVAALALPVKQRVGLTGKTPLCNVPLKLFLRTLKAPAQ